MESKPDSVFFFFFFGRDLNVFKCYWVGMDREADIMVKERGESLRWFCTSRRKMMKD